MQRFRNDVARRIYATACTARVLLHSTGVTDLAALDDHPAPRALELTEYLVTPEPGHPELARLVTERQTLGGYLAGDAAEQRQALARRVVLDGLAGKVQRASAIMFRIYATALRPFCGL